MAKFNTVKYNESFGEYTMPEGAIECLSGLTINEQANYFYTVTIINPISLDKNSDVKALIVDNDIVVGVMLSNCIGQPTPCFIGQTICTWDSSDNNGAGYKTRTEYTKLYFTKDIK